MDLSILFDVHPYICGFRDAAALVSKYQLFTRVTFAASFSRFVPDWHTMNLKRVKFDRAGQPDRLLMAAEDLR